MLWLKYNTLKIGGVLLIIIPVGAFAWLYTYELFLAPEINAFEHYGFISAHEEYVYPEQIISYTFGKNEVPFSINVLHHVVCKNDEVKLDRYKTTYRFNFPTVTPKSVQDIVDERGTLENTTPEERNDIRDELLYGEGGHYIWSLHDLHPSKTSVCYVEMELYSYSKLLRFKRVVKRRGNDFLYTYPTPENK